MTHPESPSAHSSIDSIPTPVDSVAEHERVSTHTDIRTIFQPEELWRYNDQELEMMRDFPTE